MARLNRDDGRRSFRPKALFVGSTGVLGDLGLFRLRAKSCMEFPRLLFFSLVALICASLPSFAQTTDINDVHIQAEKPKDAPKETPKENLVASTTGLSAHVRPVDSWRPVRPAARRWRRRAALAGVAGGS